MKKILLIVALTVFRLMPVSAQTDWKLATDKDGIKIYTSVVPESKIKAVKVECVLNATPAQMVNLLMDVKNSPEWVYHVKSAVVVKQVSANELYYYEEVTLPWPLISRDFVAHLTVSQNSDTKVVTIDGPVVAGMVPEKKGMVRITDSQGKWIITPMGYDKIKVEYTIHANPGGTLPAWLINMFATEGPQKIFEGIKAQLQKPAYKNNVLAAVKN